MYRILILAALLLLPALRLSAQAGWQKVDSVTWQLYSGQKWDSLHKEAEKALKNQIDFYFLRVRAGVAAWELKKYRTAIRYFQEARKTSPGDEFVNSYYYSSLLLAGREDEANALADQLPTDFTDRQQIKRKGFVNSITMETLCSSNRQHPALTKENIDSEGSFSTYRSVLDRMWYKNLGLDHHISSGFDLYHSFSHIRIDRTQQFQSVANQLDASKKTYTSQFQYFIQGRMIAGKGWQTTLAYSNVWGDSYYHYPENQSSSGYIFPRQTYAIRDQLVNFGISKELTFLRPRISFTTGKINGLRQYQMNGQIIVYPLGNLNLYFLSEGSMHADGSEPLKTVYTQKAGIRTGPVWWTGEATFGKIRNFSMDDGLVIYNMPETIDGMYGLTLWIPLFKYKLNLAARYLMSEKTGMTFVYTDAVRYSTRSYGYTDQSILISLKWNL